MTALLLTRDPDLRAEVARLAAAAGADVDAREVTGEALVTWSTHRVVLVGDDLAGPLADLRPTRRGDLWVVLRGEPDSSTYRAAVDLGAQGVVTLAGDGAEDWFVDLLADLGDRSPEGRLVGVLGGHGGAGATTLACALAQAHAGRAPTLLVDTDRLGPGLDRVFGLEDQSGVRWPDLAQTSGRLGSRALRDAVPRVGDLGILTWPATDDASPAASVVRETLAAAVRGHELVVLDLARHGHLLLEELAHRCDEVLVVSRATVPGVAATLRLVRHLGLTAEGAGLVLRPGAVGTGAVEEATGLRVRAVVGRERGLGEALDLGLGPLRARRGPLHRATRDLLGVVA